MKRAQAFLVGLAAGGLALAWAADGRDGIALAIAPLSVAFAACRPAALLGGGAAGLVLAHSVLERAVPAHLVRSSCVVALALLFLARGRLAWRVADAVPPALSWLGHAAAAATLAFALKGTLLPVVRVSGYDLGALSSAASALLAAAAVAAAAAGFVAARHATARRCGAPLAAAAVVALLFLELHDRAALIDLAERVQGPAISRGNYLAGVALLALATGGGVLAATGALCAIADRPLRGRPTAALALGAAFLLGALAPVPEPRAAAALCAPLAALASAGGALPRALLLLAGASAAHLLPASEATWRQPWLLDDPVFLSTGGDAGAGTAIRGRPIEAPAPPGFPTPPGALPELVRWLLEVAPRGRVLLAGAEAAAVAERCALRDVDFAVPPGRDPYAAVILLPSVAAEPLAAIAEFRAAVATARERLLPGGVAAFVLDLGEVDRTAIAAAARAVATVRPSSAVVLHGALAAVVGTETEFEQDPTGPPLPALALSTSAAAELAAAGERMQRLALGSARTRLATRSPLAAAANLRWLLARSDLLAVADPSVPSRNLAARARLEFAAAVLADEFDVEDRLLLVLGRAEPAAAAALARERTRARARLREDLLRLSLEQGSDADVRRRLGRILAHGGNLAGGIYELTRAFELRLDYPAALVELAEAYLAAEVAGYRKPLGKGAELDSVAALLSIAELLGAGIDAELMARFARLSGLAIAADAARPALTAEARRERLERVPALLDEALHFDPFDAAALAGRAFARAALGDEAGAAADAARAVQAAPLDPRARLARAVAGGRAEAARADFAAALALGLALRPAATGR